MPRQKTCRLGGDHASLDAGQRRLGFVERQTDRLQPIVTLVEMHDLALADHAVVVGHDPELDLNTHARPKGCFCWSASLPAADTLDQIPTPTVCNALVILFDHVVFILTGAVVDLIAEFLGDGLGVAGMAVGGGPLGLDPGVLCVPAPSIRVDSATPPRGGASLQQPQTSYAIALRNLSPALCSLFKSQHFLNAVLLVPECFNRVQ